MEEEFQFSRRSFLDKEIERIPILNSMDDWDFFAVVVVHRHTFRFLSDILNSLRQLGQTTFD